MKLNDCINGNETGGDSGTCKGREKSVQGFMWTLRQRTRGRWKVKIKWILRIKIGGRGQHSSGSELVHVAGCCDPDDELRRRA